jgi:phage baseplate assembly protein W
MSGTVTWQQTVTGTRAVPTLLGDTMERIALRETGDAANWYQLVALNGLLPPYISDDPTVGGINGVLLAGQNTVKVTSPAPAASGVADADDVFGTDVLLTSGQMTIGAAGDFQTVTGPDNLVQAMNLALGTHQGELVYHSTYGDRVFELLGKPNNGSIDQLAAAYVSRCIAADPRIDSVSGVTVTAAGGTAALVATAVAVNGKRLPVGTTLNGSTS